MNLLENPFFLLGATPRDNRRRIIELAEERSLTSEIGDFSAARADLTNPKKRLAAEIAWLPGLGPRRAKEAVLLLKKGDHSGIFQVEKIPPMARSNLLSAGLLLLDDASPSDVADWILELAQVFEDIESDKLLAVINQDRVVSGFPEISEEALIESEIQQRRSHFRLVMKSALDKLSSDDLVEAVTIAVESATDYGEEQGPVLIDDLVDAYEVEAQSFLEKEGANIQVVIERIRTAADQKKPDQAIAVLIKQLISMIKNWDRIAQPIQVSKKSRGLDHDESHRVGIEVRGLAIDLFNKHNMLDFSKVIIESLGEVFSEVVGFAEKIEEDSRTVSGIAEQRVLQIEEAKIEAAKFREEITYEVNLGLIFKKWWKISPDGIGFKGNFWPLDSITRVRWGGTRHYVNGQYKNTTYSIFYGTRENFDTLDLDNEGIYNTIIEKLWRAVCVRILTEYLSGLNDGKWYRFGSALVNDYGVKLKKSKIFSADIEHYYKWHEIQEWNTGGHFCLGKSDNMMTSILMSSIALPYGFSNQAGVHSTGKKSNVKLYVALSYSGDDNIHILESMLRMLHKNGGETLSSLLDT